MYIYKDDSIELLKDTFKHLKNGQFKLALTSAQKVYINKSEDPVALSCYAWANLENGNYTYALELADLAVMYSRGDLVPKFYRGYFLYRMGIYEGALKDLEVIKSEDVQLNYWAQLNKARALSGTGQFDKAFLLADKLCGNGKSGDESFQYIKHLITKCKEYQSQKHKPAKRKKTALINEAAGAFEKKEYWFSLWASKEILINPVSKKEFNTAAVLQLSSLIKTFQFKLAFQKAEQLKNDLNDDSDFKILYQNILKYFNAADQSEKSSTLKNFRSANAEIKILSSKTFNFNDDPGQAKKKYLKQFNENDLAYVGIETIAANPYYRKQSMNIEGMTVWYLNETEIGRSDFTLYMDKEWERVEFVQSWGNDYPGYWAAGSGRIEIYLNNELKVNKTFDISYNEVSDEGHEQPYRQVINSTAYKANKDESNIVLNFNDDESLDDLLDQLNKYIGLDSVKNTMKDFVNYLQFINERKNLGLPSEDKLSMNCIFLGNPGTGKTTTARLLGKIFRSIGMLKSGHLLEVDRAGLVGQYVGETAQKTEKVINEAMGGLLFIDEAYSLSKKGNTQDFGQEAVDILLKRMEDCQGEFAVIAAGYPEEMKSFINSNPGLRSRFNHHFDFEDFTPEELIKIFTQLAEKEQYKIDEDALNLLLKEFTELYRKRDKNFGNARLVKNYFNELKLQVGKRSLKYTKKELTKETLSTIVEDDIKEVFAENSSQKVNIKIDEVKLQKSLSELNNLKGLESVKKEINEIVKLARYYSRQGESLQDKFASHFVFLGNPGTGKTSVARLFSQIYSALGILSKGHLVEAGRKEFVGRYIGETAIKTSDLIDKSIGGTLFIDEAHSLVKSNNPSNSDFGSEAVDILLKRMEDQRGEFITIAAGYSDQMKLFLKSNPGLDSRFTNTFLFEDFTPKELLHITEEQFKIKNYQLSPEAKVLLEQHYEKIYTERDNSFGNARVIRNIVESLLKNHLLKMSEKSSPEKFEDTDNVIDKEEVESLLVKTKGKIKSGSQDTILEKYLDDLDKLTGLSDIKTSISNLIKTLRISQLKKEQGISAANKNLNFVFTGNPGTGKRTVAKLLGNILREMEILSSGHVIEAGRKEFLSGFPGEIKTNIESIISKSLGGILFINEMDELQQDSIDFKYYITDVLGKAINENGDKFVVILSGCKEEIKDFLNGLLHFKVNFNNYLDFQDFNPRQMLDIALSFTEKNGYKLDEGAWQMLLDRFAIKDNQAESGFTNAHFIQKIIHKSISNQEERISLIGNPGSEDLSIITMEDIEKINLSEF